MFAQYLGSDKPLRTDVTYVITVTNDTLDGRLVVAIKNDFGTALWRRVYNDLAELLDQWRIINV